ncbi:PIG-L deacetylase family protein [Actinomadura rupiterrae]|uniref:PIG-L deacetylase family protein n=1 Tax=Actinomadura rupiterrae TaxID=559627 RepID=UPI0020A46E7A|nr:PIG-L deacetylase family protein [Actinomadura rupiterrae]MCP2341096.1 LmbE family N-acetylglucosaminyl deacetylase [Actinomadura rupiterrae]
MSRADGLDARRVLAVFAHPDDAELACGGTLAAFRHAGYDVHIVALTDGFNSSVARPQDRVREAAASAAIIGATITIESLPDGDVRVARETYAKIESHLRRVAPTVVMTHYTSPQLQDDHQDHQATGLVATTLAKRVPSPRLILQGEPPVLNSGFIPNLYVNVTDFMDKKLAAIAQYQSEASKPYMREEALLARARWWARQARVHEQGEDEFCEAFQLVKCRSINPHQLIDIRIDT